MKKIFLVLLMVLTILTLGCAANQEPGIDTDAAGVIMINVEEAKNRLDNEEVIILVDVRTPEEYKDGHIPGAILFPVDEIEKNAETMIPDKEATYFIYCRSGNRSAAAADLLVEMGYHNVYDLGGINNWTYETVTGDE